MVKRTFWKILKKNLKKNVMKLSRILEDLGKFWLSSFEILVLAYRFSWFANM